MKKQTWFLIIVAIVVTGIVVILVLVRGTLFAPDQLTKKELSPDYQPYIHGFTSGMISAQAGIKVVLSDDYLDSTLFSTLDTRDLFSLKPSVRGTVQRLNDHTVMFQPDEPLEQGEIYRVNFHLEEILDLHDTLGIFTFGFQVIPQEMTVEVLNIRSETGEDPIRATLFGMVTTADIANVWELEKTISVTQSGRELPLSWSHDPNTRKSWFQADSIHRGSEATTVRLAWDGEPIDAPEQDSEEFLIPPLDAFVVMDARMTGEEGSCIVINFSDPLNTHQVLKGLVRIGEQLDSRYRIIDNQLKLYPGELDGDSITIVLDAAIRNSHNRMLGKKWKTTLPVLMAKPAVRFVSDGVILPGGSDLLLPIEAINLKAIDITIVRVFATNILQFLQRNDFNESEDLVRVGRVVLKKTIPLTGVIDYGIWNRFTIDMSTLIKQQPGALYHVMLSMKQAYSAYPCDDASADTEANGSPMTLVYNPDSLNQPGWDYYGSYTQWDYSGYQWRDRDNPCKRSYYMNKTVSRNILTSDLGLMVKTGNDQAMKVYVNDLTTAQPLSGVSVTLYDFQQKEISQSVTNPEGMTFFTLEKNPAFVVASRDNQKGYLRLPDGASRSLSMFDVGGEVVEKGLKGYLYGERGVWRPGDSIFLTFVLQDPGKRLPRHHPVTMTLFNPRKQMVYRMVKNSATDNLYTFSFQTPKDAITGNWLASVTVGGAQFSKVLKVETVKPNRLKIKLSVPGNKLQAGEIPELKLQAAWLTGPPASGLDASVNLTLTQTSTSFSDYPGFSFDDPFTLFEPQSHPVFHGALNDSGLAFFRPDLGLSKNAPGMLRASFETMVFEPGGDFSVDRFFVPYAPYTSFAGIRIPDPGPRQFNLITEKRYDMAVAQVDPDGNPFPSGELLVEVFRLDWRWWWDDGDEGRSASFLNNMEQRRVRKEFVTIKKGKGSFSLKMDRDEWGRYFIRVTDQQSGHQAGSVVWFDWAGYNRMPGGEKEAAAMLSFSSDKPVYEVGDKATITFPSSKGGKALISIETGSGVLDAFWKNTDQGETKVSFEITPEMAPNVYAAITLLQPYDQTINDLPLRLYGVIPLMVEDPETHLYPEIFCDPVLVPGKEATIRVKEKDGRRMTYTLAIVDEGLLDLTRFKTPDPWDHFFAREALGVKTWDMYDLVMGASAGELQRLLSIGGDEESRLQGNLKANRFEPMVKFLGPFSLGRRDEGEHAFLMPEYIGSVRIMVVGVSEDAYGSAQKEAFVRKPLMVQGTLPRVLGPGEQVSLPVTVFAMEEAIHDVSIELKTNGLFEPIATSTRHLRFDEKGEQVVFFDLSVKKVTGIGKVTIRAIAGNHTASTTIELDVRNPNPPVSQVSTKSIPPNELWETSYQAIGLPGSNSGSLELSILPPMNLEKRLGYLVRYPYGCLEQTVSAVFPQLYLDDLMALSPDRQREIQHHVLTALGSIGSFQISNGAFSPWKGGTDISLWSTNYAGHFMLEAAKKGYTIPQDVLLRWKQYQQRMALEWEELNTGSNNSVVQAYRLYTLALAGEAPLSAMNKLRSWEGIGSMARWFLAGAYQLAGKPEIARSVAREASIVPEEKAHYTISFGSSLRDQALIANILCLMDMPTRATPLIRQIAADLSSDSWYSTQTTAFALMAVSSYAGHDEEEGFSCIYQFNGEDPVTVNTRKSLEVIPLAHLNVQPKGGIRVNNNNKKPLFAQLLLEGTPLPGAEEAAAHDLKIQVEWKDMDGKKVDVRDLIQGQTFIAQVSITNPGYRGRYDHLALSQIIPSGWEIINARMSTLAATLTPSSSFEYQYIGDDRVNTFFSLDPGKTKHFSVLFTATYPGRFYLPAFSCEEMYDHSIYARTKGYWVKVVASGQ